VFYTSRKTWGTGAQQKGPPSVSGDGADWVGWWGGKNAQNVFSPCPQSRGFKSHSPRGKKRGEGGGGGPKVTGIAPVSRGC